MDSLYQRIAKAFSGAWSIFRGRDPTTVIQREYYGTGYGYRPDRIIFNQGIERTILSALYNRIAIDVSTVEYMHCRLDENGNFQEKIRGGLNTCLTTRANIDQTGIMLIRDIALSLFNDGSCAVVITSANNNPYENSSIDIKELRVGKIVEWYPRYVRVSLYNDILGQRIEYTLPKERVAIIENPLYPVMNEPNSIAKRLVDKLNQLDALDDILASGKLDLIIQLPYSVRSELKKAEADQRLKDVEMQLTGSKHGIAYIDATERVTQLNRPVENNIMPEVEYLTKMLLSQLGFTEGVFNGQAEEEEMLNYYNRTVDPVIKAICDAFKVSFLTQTAIAQGQTITFFRDPFKLVSASALADITDKFTRNEIMTSNEVRSRLGLSASNDPRADLLKNKNLKDSDTNEGRIGTEEESTDIEPSKNQNLEVKGENSQNGKV